MQSPIIERTDVETPADITVYFLSKLMGKVLQVSVFKSDKPVAFGGATISAPVKVSRQKVRPPKPARTSCNVVPFFNVWAALNIALMKGLTTPSTAEVDVALPPSKALVMSLIMSIGAVKMSMHWFIGIIILFWGRGRAGPPQGSSVALRCVLLGLLASIPGMTWTHATKFLLEFCLCSNYIVVVMSHCHIDFF